MIQTGQLLSSMFNRISPTTQKPIELEPGQVFKGTVTKLLPDNMALVQMGGVTISAKLEANLEVGQKAWLQVQPTTNPVTLKVLTSPENPQQLQEPSMEGLMKSLGIPESEESRALVQTLVRQNLPVTKETVNAFLEIAKAQGNSQEVVDAFVLAMKRNLPLTNDVVGSLKTFLSGKPLSETIQQFIKVVEAFLAQEPIETATDAPSKNGAPVVDQAGLRQLVSKALAKVSSLPVELPMTTQSVSQSIANPSSGNGIQGNVGQTNATQTVLAQTNASQSNLVQTNNAGVQSAVTQQGSNQSTQPAITQQATNQMVQPAITTQHGSNTNAPSATVQQTGNQAISNQTTTHQVNSSQVTGTQTTTSAKGDLTSQPVSSANLSSQTSQPHLSNPASGNLQTQNNVTNTQVRTAPNQNLSGEDQVVTQRQPAIQSQTAIQSQNTSQNMTSTTTNAELASKEGMQAPSTSTQQTGNPVNMETRSIRVNNSIYSPSGFVGTPADQQTVYGKENLSNPNRFSLGEKMVMGDQANQRTAGSEDKSHLLKDLFQKLGVSHERQMVGPRFSELSKLDSNLENVKSLLLQVTQASGNLPVGLKDAAETLLQQVTGQQLMLSQPNNQAISQVVMQIPLRTENGDETAFIQIESKKKDGGQLDPDNCRLFFNLDLHSLGITMVDVNIVNKIVNINIYNDLPWVEGLIALGKEPFAGQLRDAGYLLSNLKTQPIPEAKTKAGNSLQPANLGSTYKGVDLRV